MRTRIQLSGIFKERIGEETFRSLAQICPDGADDTWFLYDFDAKDPRLKATMDCLSSAGWYAWIDLSRKRLDTEYSVSVSAEYDDEDLAPCRYLWLGYGTTYVNSSTRNAAGILQLDVEELVPDAEMFRAGRYQLVVSTKVKNAIETENLGKLIVKPIELGAEYREDDYRKKLRWEDYCDPFWEVTSDLILPPLAPSCLLVNAAGQPCNRDFSNGCYLRSHDPLEFPEMRYRAADLAAVEPFDIALSFERYGDDDPDREVIVSKRFYEFCLRHKIEMGWAPIRIDP